VLRNFALENHRLRFRRGGGKPNGNERQRCD
jgi:hypothetical protein